MLYALCVFLFLCVCGRALIFVAIMVVRITVLKFDNRKTNDLFSNKSKSFKTNFSRQYSVGGIPCVLSHGSVHHKLRWSTPVHAVDYQILLLLAEGLSETKHPYVFVARTAWKELLAAEGAPERVYPLLPRLTNPLRMALMSRDGGVFAAVLEAIEQLSDCVGTGLNFALPQLLVWSYLYVIYNLICGCIVLMFM